MDQILQKKLDLNVHQARTLEEQCAGHAVAWCPHCREGYELNELVGEATDEPGTLCPVHGSENGYVDLASSIHEHLEECPNFA